MRSADKQKSPAKRDSDQRDRFIEAARKAGASEDEADFDRALGRVAKTKVGSKKEPKP
jgi:hypothetical protein